MDDRLVTGAITVACTRAPNVGDRLYSPRDEEWTVTAIEPDPIWGQLYTLRSSGGRTRQSTAAAISLWTTGA